MVRNITLSIDDKLAKKMNEMKEVNWSEVARNAISQYVASKMSPDLADTIEQLAKEKTQQYSKGVEATKRGVESFGYEHLVDIFSEYDSFLSDYPKASDELKVRNLFNVAKHHLYFTHSGNTNDFKLGVFDTLMKLKEGVGIE